MLQNLSSGELIQAIAIVVTLTLGIFTIAAGVVGYLVKRVIEQGPEKDKLGLDIMRLDKAKRRAELLKMLDESELPAGATDQMRQEILEAYGETSAQYEPVLRPEIVCVLSAAPTMARAESIDELVADIELYLSTEGDSTVFEFDLEVTLSAKIGGSISSGKVDAMPLILNEQNQPLGAPAQIITDQKLSFQSVSVAVNKRTEVQKLRIVNIRVNAAQALNWIKPEDFFGMPAKDFLAFVSLRPTSNQSVAVRNELVTVALPRIGVLSLFRDRKFSPVWAASGSRNEFLLGSGEMHPATIDFHATFSEGFPKAFKTQLEEAGTVQTSASTGTRFLVRFMDVPEGVEIFVTVRDLSGDRGESRKQDSCRATLVPDATSDGSRGSPRPCGQSVGNGARTEDGVALRQIPVRGGFGFAVWEWKSQEYRRTDKSEAVVFGVVFAYRKAKRGFVAVSGLPAPVYGEALTDHVPLFVDVGFDPEPVFVIDE